jgi:hypothetical protein
VLLRRQAGTQRPKLDEFREQLREFAAGDEKYVAIVEVCGFQDWLVRWLPRDERCHILLVVQPLGRSPIKTDRRDAHALDQQPPQLGRRTGDQRLCKPHPLAACFPHQPPMLVVMNVLSPLRSSLAQWTCGLTTAVSCP